MSHEYPPEQGAFGASGTPPREGEATTPIPPVNDATTPVPPPPPAPHGGIGQPSGGYSQTYAGYGSPASGYAPQATPFSYGAAGSGGQPAPTGPADGGTGFLSALFDFSFTHFVTPQLVRIVYILVTIFLGLAWLFYTVVALAASTGFGLLVLVGGGFVFLIYLALARMSLEFFLSVVRMSEDIHKRLPQG